MPSLVNSIFRFARSPQGRRLAQQAIRYAQDPATQRKIVEARKRLAARNAKKH